MKDVVSGDTRVSPTAMVKQHQSNIFCLGFTGNNSKIVSGGNDEMVLVHDVATLVYKLMSPQLYKIYLMSISHIVDENRSTHFPIRSPSTVYR